MKYVFLKIFYENENIQFITNWSYIIYINISMRKTWIIVGVSRKRKLSIECKENLDLKIGVMKITLYSLMIL